MSTNKELLSIFQNIIDYQLINSSVKLILLVSHVGMVEDSISYKKPLYGRATFKMKVEPFDYYDASKFYPNATNIDKIRLYSVFGGVPFYTSRIDDTKSVKDNIISLIIEEGAMFEDEVSFFLSQEVRSVSTYGKIINAIAMGATKLNEISTKSGTANSGTTSKYLDLLITLGIVEKEYCFGEGTNTKKTIYKVKDQLFNFNYTFIEKYRTQKVIMKAGSFYDKVVQPYLDEFVSCEFERICTDFLKRVEAEADRIEEIGRYWYNDSKLRRDVEIDIAMERAGALFAFECKWTNAKIDKGIECDLEKKVQYLGDVIIGFFSKSGYSNVQSKHLYTVDDLYDF